MRLALAVLVALLVIASPAVAQEQVDAYPDGEATTFGPPNLEDTEYTVTVVLEREDGKKVSIIGQDRPAKFTWTCQRLGRWTWTATIVYPDGRRFGNIGALTIPGPCDGQRSVPVLRKTVLNYLEDGLRPRNLVIDRSCRARVRPDYAGRSTSWLCAAVWLTGPRACGARYVVRRLEYSSFGEVLATGWDARRVSRFICK